MTSPIVLLAGQRAGVIKDELQATRKFTVRLLHDLADCGAFRNAIQGCFGVFATPDNADQSRNVIKVVAGSTIEHLVIATRDEGARLDAYARGLGINPLFVDLDTRSATWFFIKELEETRWQPFAVPYLL